MTPKPPECDRARRAVGPSSVSNGIRHPNRDDYSPSSASSLETNQVKPRDFSFWLHRWRLTSKSTDLHIPASQHSAASARGGKDESRGFDEGLGYAFAPTERDTQTWVSRLEHQPFLEGPRAVARHLKLCLGCVLESDDQAPPEVGTDFSHPGQVDDRATVNANELPRIQPLFELAERAIDQMAARRRHGQRPLPLSQEVRDFHGLHEVRALLAEIDADAVGVDGPPSVAVVTGKALEHCLHAGGARISAAALEALERALDALALDGFEEIVDGGGLESLQRVVIIGGDEHDQRARGEPLEQLEAGHPGHVDVEEERLDLARWNFDQRGLGRGRRPHHVDPPGRFQALHHLLERPWLVVDDVSAEPAAHARSAIATRAGSDIVILAPSSPCVAASVASGPKRTASRERSVSSPWPAGASSRSKPGPSSHTETARRSPVRRASTRISAPAGRAAATCLTLFCTRVCSARGGTGQARSSSGTSTFVRSRSPSRACSISR